MKFSLATLALLAEGAQNGKGGKHGGIEMGGDNERWVWDTPKCLSNSADCSQTIELTDLSGEIKFNAEDYVNFKNSLYTISLPGRHIQLQFDQDHDFGMEFHKQCGFDRLQIFTGNAATFDKTNRIARFCGPKKGSKPFDGSGKLKEVDGVMPMWDEELNTMSSDVLIGLDLDQDFDGYSGFTLKYTSFAIVPPVLDTFQKTAKWNEETIKSMVNLLEWKNPKAAQKSINSYFANVYKRASIPNQKCNKKWEAPVSGDLQSWMKEDFAMSMDASMDNVTSFMNKQNFLMLEYVGSCKGAAGWPRKYQSIIRKLRNNLK